ncbi:Protein-lysine N-methyltransferase efm4 [Dimargaris verticillata]|uniref:Protein-lysine N-methyltransferase EFM4 n=1 Tax=Dimargaris verticillata TaxID=2761393 RepID=A0A9W8E7F8_9FUNG|nr:Protein-lysine N-methyltransferase efm4 [Dimargaris verticillata]
MSAPVEADFGPSDLGTREYWDTAYKREIRNFQDHGDIGEVWFGEDTAERMVEWVEEHYSDASMPRVLDLGCGNGHLLLELAERGYQHLFGVDYSETAIILARTIATQTTTSDENNHDSNSALATLKIDYQKLDLLDANAVNAYLNHHASGRSFDIILDKGTLDAISLCPLLPSAATTGAVDETLNLDPKQRYRDNVHRALSDDGMLLITSCNWTQDELIKLLEPRFVYSDHIQYPTFQFGGVAGQKTCTVAFTKR